METFRKLRKNASIEAIYTAAQLATERARKDWVAVEEARRKAGFGPEASRLRFEVVEAFERYQELKALGARLGNHVK